MTQLAVNLLAAVIAIGASYWLFSSTKSKATKKCKEVQTKWPQVDRKIQTTWKGTNNESAGVKAKKEKKVDKKEDKKEDKKVDNKNEQLKEERSAECFTVLFTGPNLVNLRLHDKIIQYASKEEAFEAAKSTSGGLKPLSFRPDGPVGKPHFHLHKNWYFVDEGKLYRYHFSYPEK